WIYTANNRPVHITIPAVQMPNPNAHDDFVLAGNLAKAMQHKSPYSMPQPTLTFTAFQAAARDAQPVLAAGKPGLDHDYRNAPLRSTKTRLPEFALFREVARVESGVAMYYEMDGRPAKATEARLDALEMGVMIPRGGTLIAGLVGVACEAIAANQFEWQI